LSRKLIVNADDYGLTSEVSRGIREAHLRGIVSSTNAMMNMPGVESELKEAIDKTPRLGLGVHLNLTAGSPLLEAGQIPSLVDEEGRFWQEKTFIDRLEIIKLEEAEREWEAQVSYFTEVTGRKPTHLDSHHHCSFFSPGLFQAMLKLAKKHQCAIRNIFNETRFPLPEDFLTSNWDEFSLWSKCLVEEYQIPQPDHFISSFYGKSATLDNMRSIIGRLPEGISEVMCHPGYTDDNLAQKSSYAGERERELEILTHKEIISLVRRESLELISFDGIQRGT
jgi:predicted glycoside hydrolase/deacetylase ChbG (UPF0249 family)